MLIAHSSPKKNFVNHIRCLQAPYKVSQSLDHHWICRRVLTLVRSMASSGRNTLWLQCGSGPPAGGLFVGFSGSATERPRVSGATRCWTRRRNYGSSLPWWHRIEAGERKKERKKIPGPPLRACIIPGVYVSPTFCSYPLDSCRASVVQRQREGSGVKSSTWLHELSKMWNSGCGLIASILFIFPILSMYVLLSSPFSMICLGRCTTVEKSLKSHRHGNGEDSFFFLTSLAGPFSCML